jgi:hypothetical protein
MGSYVFHSDRHKDLMRETTGIRNFDMLTQLPGSMSRVKIFVRPEEVRYLVVDPRIGC